MINKKVFALTLVASSVIAAGCSSDDDDDGGDMAMVNDCESIATDAQSIDVDGNGEIGNAGDDVDNNCFIDEQDVDAFAEQQLTDTDTDTDPDTDVGGSAVIGETSITAAVRDSDDFTQLSMDIDTAGLDGTLGDDNGTFTVFAPNNNAYAAFDTENPGVADGFRANPDDGNLANVLTYHVLPTRETIESLKEMLEDTDDDGSIIGETVDIETVQGDSVTISAIDNDADDALVGDDLLTINGIPVVAENTEPSNGNVLVLNSGLLVPTTGPAPMTGGEEDMEDMEDTGNGATTTGGSDLGSGVDAISANGNSEFVQIFEASGQGTVLNDQSWTIFVPTNDALDDGVTQSLVADGDQANEVVRDHIVTDGAFEAGDFPATLTSNGGVPLTFSGGEDDLTVNGFSATRIDSDSSSAIYEIDGVLQ